MAWETRNRSKNITSLPPARIRANSSISRNLPFPIKFIINFTIQPGGIRRVLFFPHFGSLESCHAFCVCVCLERLRFIRVCMQTVYKKTMKYRYCTQFMLHIFHPKAVIYTPCSLWLSHFRTNVLFYPSYIVSDYHCNIILLVSCR